MELRSVNSSISEQNCAVIGECLGAMNEELLVSAARAGDRSAFNELYTRHSWKVRQRVYSITKNREDAEDVIQEAALRAFLHLKSFEGRSSFSSWLTRIAINSALMTLRKKRRDEISIDQTCDQDDRSRPWEPCDNAETPEARYARCEREALLIRAIQRLPYIFREIIELQKSNEYSTLQIAQELGISLAAAKSRLMRARKTLRRFSEVPMNCGLRSNLTGESPKPLIRSRRATVHA